MSGVVLVALALGLSNFAASIGIGLSGVDRGLRIRIAVVFGFFEAAMPLGGLVVGHRLANSIGSAGPYLGGGLLLLTGVFTIVQARRSVTNDSPSSTRLGGLRFTGAALSIDNLVVGFALGTYRVSLLLAVVVIAVVSVAMSLVGLEIGTRLGESVEQWSGKLGGAVLVLVGVAIASGIF
jgi:putative Mn2+ efflux pump MntP